eukprot:Hpha_TRINITY_DN19663_c0_g1::TRINITY_DN19663_c0_g1_i1::g.186273::m.186273/K15637/PGAM5; serine/threonine-protein phosphatase PGAM5
MMHRVLLAAGGFSGAFIIKTRAGAEEKEPAPVGLRRGSQVWGTKFDFDWDGGHAVYKKDRRERNAAKSRIEGEEGEFRPGEELLLPPPTKRVILIRHGQYQNESKCDEDDSVCTLTLVGKQQAEFTGRWLASMEQTGGVKIRRVVASDLTRAKETASIIAGYLGRSVEHDERLREGFPCRPEPDHPTWVNAIPEEDRIKEPIIMEEAFLNVVGPRERPLRRKVNSLEEAKEVVKAQPECHADVVVCHGNVIRYFVCRSLQVPPERWLNMTIGNGSMTTIDVRGSGMLVLRGVGEHSHVPFDKRTSGNISGPDPALAAAKQA